MAEEGLDALVVRAPDNVLYLTNFWGMKGYDACVFPREGEPVLITIEASEEDAARTGVDGGRALHPRLRPGRSAAAARAHARRGRRGRARLRARRPRALARHAGVRPHGRRADDVHDGVVRRVPGRGRRDAAARPRAHDQDRAGDRAPAARERDRGGGDGARPRAAAAGDEGGRGRRALAGLRPRRGHRLATARSSSRSRSRSSGPAAGSRRSPRPATCPSSRASPSCSRSGSAPTATGPTTRRTSSSAS